ncbi:hypothetical protein XK97_07490 [Obesumbacterium proteus]|nr:hypothetical protein XK97_07490 [Obesumbacterium proteus]
MNSLILWLRCSYIYGYKTLSSWSEVMTKSDVVRARVSPAELLKPNAKTLKAIRDLEACVGVNRASNIDELKADLGW